jgi:hypothetical protein
MPGGSCPRFASPRGPAYPESVLFLGHIAISLILADATNSDRKATVAGNLMPDVVDKSLRLVHIAPSTRWIAHGLPFALLVCLLMGRKLEPRAWRGFVLGYAGHLIADLYAGNGVPWLAPFNGPYKESPGVSWLVVLLPELIGALVIWLKLRRPAFAGPDRADAPSDERGNN